LHHPPPLADYGLGSGSRLHVAGKPRCRARSYSSPAPGHLEGDRDFVTELDLEIRETMQRLLRAQVPQIAFRGEESITQSWGYGHAERTWVLDPIDGTANFIHNIALCAVSLAHAEKRASRGYALLIPRIA
jgi:fructose-1,6-bisphosphatase/inositol monophosphatase family enzyme